MSKDILSYDFKPGFKHEIEVVSLEMLSDPNKIKLIHPHRANFYMVIWFMDGPYEHQLDFVPIKVPKQSLLFVNQRQVHNFDKHKEVKGKLMLFTDRFFYRNADSMHLLNNFTLFNDYLEPSVIKLDSQTAHLRECFEKIEHEFTGKEDMYRYHLLHNQLCIFLIMAERQRLESGFEKFKEGPDLDYLTLFRDLLEKNFRQRNAVSSYAREMNISEKRLAQATCRTIGRTPKQLIDDRLILEAKRLTIHTQQTIKEIGYSLGFDEPTNFIKYFRKHAGCTPMEFKAAK